MALTYFASSWRAHDAVGILPRKEPKWGGPHNIPTHPDESSAVAQSSTPAIGAEWEGGRDSGENRRR